MEQRGDGDSLDSLDSLGTKFFVLPLILLFSLLSLSPVLAATIIDLTPVSVFEGTISVFNFTLTTSHLTKAIEEINLTGVVSNITLTNDSQFNQGWDILAGSTSMAWLNNSIPQGSFVIQTYLQFSALIPTVAADTTQHWNVLTRDNKGTLTSYAANVTVHNDPSPPILSNTNLANPTFFRGTPQLVTTQAVDPESGVSNVTFTHRACSVNSSTPLLLQKAADTPDNYSVTVDFSALLEGATLCFSLNSSARGGETAFVNGTITIDNTPPTVTALSPADNTFLTTNPNLSFAATDALSPTLSCTILLGGEVKRQLDLNTSQPATVSVNTSDGNYVWNVSCVDRAGNTASSASRTVTVDTLPPVIAPPEGPRLLIRGLPLTAHATITDFSGIATARATAPFGVNGTNQTLSSSSNGSTYVFTTLLPSTLELGAHTLTMTAEDGAGHFSWVNYSYNVTYNYNLTLLVPRAVEPEQDVMVHGTVRMDNGSLIPESSLILSLPSGPVSVLLDNQSSFTHTFSAPLTSGSFAINAGITSRGNNVTYNATASIIVAASVEPALPGGGSGRSGRSGSSTGSSADSSLSSGSSSAGTASVSLISASAASGVPSASAPATTSGSGSPASATPATTSGGTGIGRAGGFLAQTFIKYSNLIWTLFVVVLVIGVLVYISRGPDGPAVRMNHTPASDHKLVPTTLHSPQENVTRHDLDLDEYLRQRLGK